MAPAGFPVHVPRGTGDQLMASIQMIPAEHRSSWRIHRVATGETLASIVSKYGASTSTVLAANKLDKPEAIEGDRLIIPVSLKSDAPVKRPSMKTATVAHRNGQPVRRTASNESALKPTSTRTRSVIVARAAGQ
jgi:LysM repeat protein